MKTKAYIMKNSTLKILDLNHYIENILTVVDCDTHYEIVTKLGHLLFEKTGVCPKPGDIATFYGKGFGYAVQGLAINDEIIFYENEIEFEYRREKERQSVEDQKHLDYIKNKADKDKKVNALHFWLQQRIKRFRETFKSWGPKFEDYEVFCCTEAQKIWTTLKTENQIEHFKLSDLDHQKVLVPTLKFDQHSGNTMEFAIFMAKLLARDYKEDIVKAHGALCSVVGCREYGCWSVTGLLK